MTRGRKIRIVLSTLLVGSAIFLGSCSLYLDNKSNLTPSSVSVRGYTRRDGSHVSPHSRRPPGGAIHDRPSEQWMTVWGLLSLAGIALAVGPTAYFAFRLDKSKTSRWAPLTADAKYQVIAKAIEQGALIAFEYTTFHGERSSRTIRPLRIEDVHYQSRYRASLCVRGHCTMRNAERVFSYKRMEGVRIVPPRIDATHA
jgi:hypothetical protein